MHQITLKPVKVDIKRTQTKNKLSESIQSNNKIRFNFFGFPHGRLVNGLSPIFPRRSFFVVSFYMQLYTRLGLANLNFF